MDREINALQNRQGAPAPRRLPRGCRVLVARRVLLLRRLTGHAIAMHVGAPHRRSAMLGIVMPGRHRANGAATNHHSFCHLNLPCAVENSSSTLPGCPLLKCLSVHAARGTSGSRRRLAQHFRHYIGKGGALPTGAWRPPFQVRVDPPPPPASAKPFVLIPTGAFPLHVAHRPLAKKGLQYCTRV